MRLCQKQMMTGFLMLFFENSDGLRIESARSRAAAAGSLFQELPEAVRGSRGLTWVLKASL